MERKHEEGYWVKKLFEQNKVEDLMKTLLAPNRGFVNIKNLKVTNNEIRFICHYKQLLGKTCEYPSREARSPIIKDFEFTGFPHSKEKFYNFMIDLFGTEYEEELVSFLDEKLKNIDITTTSSVVKGLISYKNDLKNSLNNNATL